MVAINHSFSRSNEVVNSRVISGICRKVDEIGCTETSVMNYNCMLHNISQECKSSKFIYEENVLSTVGNYHNMLTFKYIIYTFQRDTQCCSTDCLLMHRCQLYMFRTVMVHPQKLLRMDRHGPKHVELTPMHQ